MWLWCLFFLTLWEGLTVFFLSSGFPLRERFSSFPHSVPGANGGRPPRVEIFEDFAYVVFPDVPPVDSTLRMWSSPHCPQPHPYPFSQVQVSCLSKYSPRVDGKVFALKVPWWFTRYSVGSSPLFSGASLLVIFMRTGECNVSPLYA